MPARLVAVGTFSLTVNATGGAYQFVGLKNAPPPAGTTFKARQRHPDAVAVHAGRHRRGQRRVIFDIVMAGPAPSPTIRNTDTGNSNFRYQASSKTWVFNLQTQGNQRRDAASRRLLGHDHAA